MTRRQILAAVVTVHMVIYGTFRPPDALAESRKNRLTPPASEFKSGRVGIDCRWTKNEILIEVAPDSPASRAGLRTGDRLHEIDGIPVEKMSGLDFSRRLEGDPQTSVRVVVERGGKRLTRSMVRVPLGQIYNQALRDPKVRRVVRSLINALGGERGIRAIGSVSSSSSGPDYSWYRWASSSGYRMVECQGRARTELVYDGKSYHGHKAEDFWVRKWARMFAERPYHLVPGLEIVDFFTEESRLVYLGLVDLKAPKGLPFSLPPRVHRFHLDLYELDFDPDRGLLVRKGLRKRGRVVGPFWYLGDYHRVDGIPVPGTIASGTSSRSKKSFSFSPIPAEMFRALSAWPACHP